MSVLPVGFLCHVHHRRENARKAGDGKQVDRGHQIHYVIDGEEVHHVVHVVYHGAEPGIVVCFHLHCNHLTKASPVYKDPPSSFCLMFI